MSDDCEAQQIDIEQACGVVSARGYRDNLKYAALLFVLLALWVVWPLVTPLVLAAWFAIVASPLQRKLSAALGSRGRGSAALTSALVFLVFAPLAAIAAMLLPEVTSLVEEVGQSETVGGALSTLTGAESDRSGPREMLLSSAKQLFGDVPALLSGVTEVVVAMAVFFYAFYFFLAKGEAIYRWLLERSPLEPRNTQRFAIAFESTGRGLLVGTGLTALLQGAVATVGYVIADLPTAFLLGLLTAFASLVPVVGTALVWGPVLLALVVRGDTDGALIIGCVGILVGLVDNLARPFLSRHDRLEIPSFVLFVAMLSGVLAVGPSGIIFGPLVIALCKEGLDILKQRNARPAASTPLAEPVRARTTRGGSDAGRQTLPSAQSGPQPSSSERGPNEAPRDRGLRALVASIRPARTPEPTS